MSRGISFEGSPPNGGSAHDCNASVGYRCGQSGIQESCGLQEPNATPGSRHNLIPTLTVQTMGEIAPVRHPEPLRTVVDTALARYDAVWADGGHPHYVFPTSYDELLRITGGEAAEVGA